MMRFLKSPLGVTMLFTGLILAFQFTEYAGTMREIGLLVLLAISTFFIHELGHVVFGIVAGYQFHFLTAGPITIERNRITANSSWAYFGGIASCSPKTDDLQKISRQHFLFAAGGPILSIVVAILSLTVGYFFNLQYVQFLGVMNFVIFLVTAIPFKGEFKSDGRVMLELLSKGNEKEQFLSTLLLIKEMMSPALPNMWSLHLIQQARTAPVNEDNITVSYLLFYYDLCTADFETAIKAIDSYKALPVTKKNKMTMQFVTHMKQVDAVMQGQATVEQLRELHSMMMPIEPISFKRSEWMMAKLAGNEALATKKLAEHRAQIEQGKKQYGFYVAEEKLTDLIELKL